MGLDSSTDSQRQAISARGNVIVVAGAGTGKTRTLVERCIRLIREGCSLDQILMVTFTEAAAAEMRHRIRSALEHELAATPSIHVAEQLALIDTAAISTLHSFCLQLVRRHFYQLQLDPELIVFDSQQTKPMISETLDLILQQHYAGATEGSSAVRNVIRRRGHGSDFRLRQFVVRLHRFTQSLPNPPAWLKQQADSFAMPNPAPWRSAFPEAIRAWRSHWLPLLQAPARDCGNVADCSAALRNLHEQSTMSEISAALAMMAEADRAEWPRGAKTTVRASLKQFFRDVEFLTSLWGTGSTDPLAEDWNWVRPDMLALLQLTEQFTREYSLLKRERGGVDFADLEQLALQLLVDRESGLPSTIANLWQQQLRYIFVDEYQDINAAQDAVIRALSRSGSDSNRFLVGDIKQSIYRFRLANPRIFQRYQSDWKHDSDSNTVLLTDNFRSREAILDFVNSFFAPVMRQSIGGLTYDDDARLRFGNAANRQRVAVPAAEAAVEPPVELHLILRKRRNHDSPETEEPASETSAAEPELDAHESNNAAAAAELVDLLSAEKEARLVAIRLRALKESGHFVVDPQSNEFRPVEWRDMVVLLRSPVSRVESFAKEFNRQHVPLSASRGGFFQSLEISDLLSLLRILDNPLQDIPLLAVLRSPLAGLSLEELAEIRVHAPDELFWTALMRFRELGISNATSSTPLPLFQAVDAFCRNYERWRDLSRVSSLSDCLETVLSDTHYRSMLLAHPHGEAGAANVGRLLDLVRQYDPYQRQGLSRFLNFVAAQKDEDIDLESLPAGSAEAVRLMSIHKSKGLEFPVVVLADIGKSFNFLSLHEEVIIDEALGLCPQVIPPAPDRRYPSLPYWIAQRRERTELIGEEMRLLYVAATRARDLLILTGIGDFNGVSPPDVTKSTVQRIGDQQLLCTRSYFDWLKLWLPLSFPAVDWSTTMRGANNLLRWEFYAEDDSRLVNAKEVPDPSDEPLNPGDSSSQRGVLSALDEAGWKMVHERVSWVYPFHFATVEPAKTSVSALRRRIQAADADDACPAPFIRSAKMKTAARMDNRLDPAESGIAHHLFMQWASLDSVGTQNDIEREANRLTDAGRLSAEQRGALDLSALTTFWKSELGLQIVHGREFVRRELPFTARFSLLELAGLGVADVRQNREADPSRADPAGSEFVVIQGVIDLAVIRPQEMWVIDFKTDAVTSSSWAEKAAVYSPQLQLYSRALARIYQRPVTGCWLHFLAIGRSVPSR